MGTKDLEQEMESAAPEDAAPGDAAAEPDGPADASAETPGHVDEIGAPESGEDAGPAGELGRARTSPESCWN